MPDPELDFSHLQAARVRADRPVKYRVNWQFPLDDGTLSPRPVLHVLPATGDNPQYTAARQNGVRRGVNKLRDLTPEAEAAALAEDRGLFAKHVIVGWDEGTVVNRRGEPVPYSHAAAAALLGPKAMADGLMNDLRNFCFEWSNFTEMNVDAFAKNS